MIQFNLLPSVKAEYIKAERLQRTVIIASGLVTAAAIFLLILLLAVSGFQKHVLSGLASQVKQNSAKLQQTPNLNQILTVQDQLEALPALHNQKPVVSRLLGVPSQTGYLDQITPDQVTISDIKLDFTAHTIALTGEAPSLDVVNTFVDTLNFTDYVTGSNKGQWTAGTAYSAGDAVINNNSTIYEATNSNTASGSNEPGLGSNWKADWKQAPTAFSHVILASFGRDSSAATYSITLDFNQAIFSEAASTTLIVPNKITTRSVIDQPSVSQPSNTPSQPLFKAAGPAKS